ncbi:MAG: BatD family protein [Thiotrichaceae bacterium]
MYKLLFIYLLCVSPVIAAPQLQAILEEHEINQGDTVNLQITLSTSDANAPQPTAEPDVTPLQGSFEILSRSSSKSSRYINGENSSEITWTYLLEPQQSGHLTLPAISLATTSGTLQTQPQTLVVNQGNQRSSNSPKLEVSVSNPHPHLYERCITPCDFITTAI